MRINRFVRLATNMHNIQNDDNKPITMGLIKRILSHANESAPEKQLVVLLPNAAACRTYLLEDLPFANEKGCSFQEANL